MIYGPTIWISNQGVDKINCEPDICAVSSAIGWNDADLNDVSIVSGIDVDVPLLLDTGKINEIMIDANMNVAIIPGLNFSVCMISFTWLTYSDMIFIHKTMAFFIYPSC